MPLTSEQADEIARSSDLLEDGPVYDALREVFRHSRVMERIYDDVLMRNALGNCNAIGQGVLAAALVGYAVGKGWAESQKLEELIGLEKSET